MKKVVIIGTGIGALSAGMRLAKNKYEVHFYEQRNTPGGKCEVAEIEGYIFDKGPTLLTLPAVFRELFLATGKRLELISKVESINPAFDYYFADGMKITFPNLSLNQTCDELKEKLGEDAARQWRELMAVGEKIWDLSRTPFIENELTPLWRYFLRRGIFRDTLVIKPWLTLRKYFARHSTNPYLQKIVERYATYSGSDPRKAPGTLLSIPFIETTFGAWYIDGGIGKLAQLAAQRAQELGATFHYQSKVEQILVENQKAYGILVNGEVILADHVISGSDALNTYQRLIAPEVKVGRERRRLRKSDRAFSGFSLYLGLDNSGGTYPKLNHHTIYFCDNYENEFIDIFDAKVPVADPTIYIFTANSGTAKESWSVLVNAPLHDPNSNLDWDLIKNSYAEKIIDLIESKGLPVRNRLKVMEIRTPADLERDYAAPGGSLYGAAMNSTLATFKRARNRSPIANLYCTSGSTHPGGGLPLVGLSGEMVAKAIISADV